MKAKDINNKLEQALNLLDGKTAPKDKLKSIIKLLQGINPALDKKISVFSKAFSKVEKFEKGNFIELAAEHLPENTKEEKKRKKAILFFLKSLKELKSEIKRLEKEFSAKDNSPISKAENTGKFAKAILLAKGPLGIITIVAGIVVYLNAASVQISIHNQGCDTIYPATTIPISIPGLKLPNSPIDDGKSAIAVIPAFDISIDGTNPDQIKLQALFMSFNFKLESQNINLYFNGNNLRGAVNQFRLSDKKIHELVISC